MNSDVSLDIAATAARPMPAVDQAERPSWNAGRQRTVIAFGLSACLHALSLLLLPAMYGKGLEERAQPFSISLEILPGNTKQSLPLLPESLKPELKKKISSPAPPTAAQRAPSLPEYIENQTALLPAPARSVETAPVHPAPPSPVLLPAPPAPPAASPATPSPILASAGNERMGNQEAKQPDVADIGGTKIEAAEPRGGQNLAVVGQPTVTEATPLYLKNQPPDYPSTARRRHQQGVVLLDVLVTEQGQAADVKVFTSSGSESLDNAALTAVRQWLFEPGKRGDQRVSMRVRVPVRFSLK